MKSKIFVLSSLLVLTTACQQKNFTRDIASSTEKKTDVTPPVNPPVVPPVVPPITPPVVPPVVPPVNPPSPPAPPVIPPPSSGGEVSTGDGSGNCMMQKLYIVNNAAGYQSSITTQQNYLNTVIAGTAYMNDYYIQVRTMANIDLNNFIINQINSGTLVYNASQGNVTGLAAIDFPGGAFALDTDIYDSLSTYPGSLTPQMPVKGMEIFNALTIYIDGLKNPNQAQYKYINFKHALDMANRLDRAVAAQNSYVATGHVNLNAIPKAKRFMCAGAFPSSIKVPTVAEWLSKSVYERAVYRAAISAADALAIWNQLTPAQQAQLTAENQAVGL